MSGLPSFLSNNKQMIDFVWQPLKRAGYASTEDDLLRAIAENKTKNIVYYATLGLRLYGTRRSLASLKQLAYYPMEDVKTSSVITVGIIAGDSETPFYAQLLDSSDYKRKMYPMFVLWEVGTEEALPSVIRFAEKVLKNKVKVDKNKELPYLIEFLSRHQSPRVRDLLGKLSIYSRGD